MWRHRLFLLVCWPALLSPAQLLFAEADRPGEPLSSDELAAWIDARFASIWAQRGIKPAPVVDDAIFMRRVYLDLAGTIPRVSEVRDFLADSRPDKRVRLVDRLVSERRYAEQLARKWRRVLVPRNSPQANRAAQLEPWLEEQFAENVPYDELARRLLTTRGADSRAPDQPTPIAFYRAVGSTPDNLANAVTRALLGVRIGCAQCHDHPFADWQQEDFWGMAAFFAGTQIEGGVNGRITETRTTRIVAPETGFEYSARFLWGDGPEFPDDRYPREVLAEWITSADNPNFAATAVNRVWQYLCGRGLVEPVDDLDEVSAEERSLVLDDLADQFVRTGFDTRRLIAGICKSRIYQRAATGAEDQGLWTSRPLKTLTPEQVFNALEQALSLPISRNERSPRYNGQRAQLVARLEEAAADAPDDFRAGIPQALLLMNGRLIAEATDLEESRTLRAVVEAPFLSTRQKIETLYLSAFTRRPRHEEWYALRKHIEGQPNEQERREAYAEIFWGLLNSPEFVLCR